MSTHSQLYIVVKAILFSEYEVLNIVKVGLSNQRHCGG